MDRAYVPEAQLRAMLEEAALVFDSRLSSEDSQDRLTVGCQATTVITHIRQSGLGIHDRQDRPNSQKCDCLTCDLQELRELDQAYVPEAQLRAMLEEAASAHIRQSRPDI